MWIAELSKAESLELVARTRFGRLGCTQGLQPYVVPFYFAYHDRHLYSFSTVGKKIDWMRKNPLVCVQTDEIVSPQEWKSVVIFGAYEELPDTPEVDGEVVGPNSLRDLAYRLLQQHPSWWEPAFVKTILHGEERPLLPIYYRISIDHITGHQAIDAPSRAVGPATVPSTM